MAAGSADVTRILAECERGDAGASERLVPLLYDELRALARKHLRRERAGHTLQTTALVHEAYLRLVGQDRVDWKGKTHFMAVAGMQMRRILVDHARAVSADKRGGGDLRRVTLADHLMESPERSTELLALDEALTRLSDRFPRQAVVAELRLFSGLLVKETAYRLGVSERTVKGDWRFARAWLLKELQAA